MSTNTSGLLVTFQDDISDEAVAELCSLLLWIKGVINVQPVSNNIDQILAQSRVNHEWRMMLIDLLKEKVNL